MYIQALITLLLSTTTFAIAIPSKTSPDMKYQHHHHHHHDSPISHLPMPTHHLQSRGAADPVAQLLAIMPTANTCDGSTYTSECATAASAVAPLLAAFHQYGITTAAEQAALISWQAFESAEYKYNNNHFPSPGRPGQGTRAMLMPDFISQYAASIPTLASQMSGKDASGILTLVTPDAYSFGSAAWFYSTQCSTDIKNGVVTGGQKGWEAFLTTCVQTTVGADGPKSRIDYWRKARVTLSLPANV